MPPSSLDAAAHVVQQALTPVFLLSGIAALLGVFATRLARVSDQASALAREADSAGREARLKVLKLRSHALDWAVVLAALAGALTCSAVLVLFLGQVGGPLGARALFVVFGGAIVLTMGALTAFVAEMLLAARGVRLVVERERGR